ncbi:MAG: aspartate aminotransferase family protein [Methylococcales bacterium]|nr:aspartate aminotransferase family protein [Methylococcales bacterium]
MSTDNAWDIDMKFLNEYEQRHTDSYALASEYMNPKLIEVMDILGFNKHYTRAEGNYLYDDQGHAYLDMHSGEGFASLGHNHPTINRALIKALQSNMPDGVQIHHSTLSGMLAENLCQRLPDGLDRVFFTNSGTETVEAALKFARGASKRPRLLSCDSGYHGLTYGALSVSSEEYFRKGFGPLLPDCDRVPYNDLERLEQELSRKDVAAFIVEPIQGRAVTLPDPGYFKEVERLCRKYGTYLIFDEIQTGLGRTGRWFALEHWGIEPDFVLVAKALSGGHMPVGAMISRKGIFDKVFNTLDRCYVHHSTYGRNRLSMVAGLATLEVMAHDKLVENAERMGKRLLDGLKALQARYSLLKDVRGMGLMVGFELGCPESLRSKVEWKLIHTASAGLFPQLIVIPLHRDHHIITMASGHNDVIKLLPTLVITEQDVDHFLNAMEVILRNSEQASSENWKTIFQIAKRTLKMGD